LIRQAATSALAMEINEARVDSFCHFAEKLPSMITKTLSLKKLEEDSI